MTCQKAARHHPSSCLPKTLLRGAKRFFQESKAYLGFEYLSAMRDGAKRNGSRRRRVAEGEAGGLGGGRAAVKALCSLASWASCRNTCTSRQNIRFFDFCLTKRNKVIKTLILYRFCSCFFCPVKICYQVGLWKVY